MASTSSRFGPLQILDADWRRKVWKRWLRSQFADSEAKSPPTPPAAVATTMPPPPDAGMNSQREGEVRRGDVRARFDALFDRLLALEDTLDALSRRFALSGQQERRQQQRLFERIESTANALERQSLILESLAATLQRIELRVDRSEQRLRSNEGSHLYARITESRRAPAHEDIDDLSDFDDTFGPTAETRSSPPEALDYWDNGAHVGPSIRGNLSEMSLATVLAMLELERRTGVLTVCAEDGSVVTATLREGAIVGARNQELEADPVEAIREALRFERGRFSFRQAKVEVVSGPPRSIGSTLLEASSRNDEAARTG